MPGTVASMAGLVLATFVSEDAACVTAGLLVQRGDLSGLAAITACAAGIFLGDVGLWLVGRFGRRLVHRWAWLGRRVRGAHGERWRAWLERRPAMAVLGSRFVPGARLPVYVGAGLLGMPLARFATWAAVGSAVWAPIPVLATAAAGQALLALPGLGMLPRWTLPFLAGAVVLIGLTSHTWTRSVARWRRWEFWPMWLFYAPVVAWVGWLVLRHRSFRPLAAANPGIPNGGLAGESKYDIQRQIPAPWAIPVMRILAETPDAREREVATALALAGWACPVVLKPDVGQRGSGVLVARSMAEVRRHARTTRGTLLVQPYHPGPFEAGLLYCRRPGEVRGRLTSITIKNFPHVIGDGRRTLTELIDADPRYRLQRATFQRRLGGRADAVPAKGERVVLTDVGNHAQGTVFRDGADLWTAALEARLDAIANAVPGFFIGRFDVRYRDEQAFRAGADLAIVELNGVAGEPTHIYDPDASIFAAWRTLFRHWSLVFEIGRANLDAGRPVAPAQSLADLVWEQMRS